MFFLSINQNYAVSTFQLKAQILCILISNRRRKKKKIRRIIDDAELGEETRKKIAIEKVSANIEVLFFFLISCLMG